MRIVSKLVLTSVIGGLAVLPSACGDDADTTSAAAVGSTGAGGAGGGTQDIQCDSAPSALSLAGTWVAYGRLDVTLEGAPGGAITICPAGQMNESTMLLMLTIDQAEGATALTNIAATLCSIELPVVTALVGDCDATSDSLVSTQIIVPPALLESLPTIATNVVGGTLAGTENGAGIDLERFVVTVGSTKGGADLPSWSTTAAACGGATVGRTDVCDTSCVDDCAALRDDDSDSYPGVTADVCGSTSADEDNGVLCNAANPSEPGATLQGRAFLDLEVNPMFRGAAKSSCEIEGTVDTEVLYNVIGGDIYLGGAPISVTSAIKSLPTFQVNTQNSKFRMVRIDGQYGAPDYGVDPTQALAACAEIRTHINEL